MELESKNAVTSKTAIVNVSLAGMVSFIPGLAEIVSASPEIAMSVFALINLVLRKVTGGGIHLIPRK